MASRIFDRWWIPSAGAEKGGEGRRVPDMPPDAGRWCVMRASALTDDARAVAFADQLLVRWGVIFRDLLAREALAPPWRDLLPVLRRKEAQGEIRGGRFVSGFSGEQFARPEALDLLRAVRRSDPTGRESRYLELRSVEPGRHHSAGPARQHAATRHAAVSCYSWLIVLCYHYVLVIT